MAHLPKISLAAACLFSLLTACGSRDVTSETRDVTQQSANFCGFSEASTGSTSLWSASRVQSEVGTVAAQRPFCATPHGAYVSVYKDMTLQRDKARCTPSSAMSPTDSLDRRLNDALAQLMTQNYLSIVSGCFKSGPQLPDSANVTAPDNQWCRLHDSAEKENWDSVRVALGSTAIYLSSHMAIAVAALPHMDSLWAGTIFNTSAARLERMKKFKPAYDSFNSFLAKNLPTVSSSLAKNGFLKNPLLEAGSSVAALIPGGSLVFGKIRDTTFAQGLELAAGITTSQHPWLGSSSGTAGSIVTLDGPAVWKAISKQTGKTLKAIEKHAIDTRSVFSSPATGILGGRTFTDAMPSRCR